MDEIEQLIHGTFPTVEKLMEEYGEFYPLANAIKNNGEMVPVGTYYGEEHPKAHELLEKLKEAFYAKKNDYKALVIFYNVEVINPETNLKNKAIAVLAEEKAEKISYTFFYPFSIKKKEMIFYEPWKSSKEIEIFRE